MEETLLRFLLLLLLLHSLLVSASMASHAPFSLHRDAKALITFSKTIEKDPNGVFQNWSSHNPCFWTGINCFEQRVESLNLSNSGLMGFLQLDLLMAMKNLRYVFLQGNKFYGNLSSIKSPSSCSFVAVDLSYNNFTANIPAGFLLPCTQLLTLNLSYNLISGGVYPYSPSVQVLDLSHNQFSDHGLLNYSFSNCKNLVNLDLSFNNFTGTVPPSLSSCTNLELLDLSANGFSGTIPSGICPSLSKLQKIYMADNYITGSLPSELRECKKLKTIGFSFNLLSGPVPPEILSLPQLTDLNLCANNINGVIPETVCKNSQNLQTLILNNNFITGTIPSNLANCKNLGWLSLANNRLTGPIPPSIGTLNKLEFMQLSNNSLTGNIPPELGNCRNLIYLDLNSNNLTGSLPPELTKQTGKIIAGFMAGIQTAFLYNKGGTACRGVGQLFMFVGIRLDRLKSYSALTDCPPTQIYTNTDRAHVYPFKNDGSMLFIDVSYNSLSGTIDESFGAMPYLQDLQLSHNGFTGTIPDNFGDLKIIIVLDLSHNQLHGHIPNSLGSLSALDQFDVSNNNLSGKIPFQDRLTAFPAAAFENNAGLCGYPLPECRSYPGGVAGGEPSSSKSTGGSSFAWKEVPFAVGAVIGTAVSVLIQIKFCRKYMGFAVGVVVEIAVCLSIITGVIFAFLK